MSLSIHFHNHSNKSMNVKVNHSGCAEVPWEDGMPQCWWEKVDEGNSGVYVPSSWVTNFGTWIDMIVQGVVAIVVTVATAGAGTAEVVAGEAIADAAEGADVAYEMSSDVAETVFGEGAGSAVSDSEDAIEAVDSATKMSMIRNVAKSVKMTWRGLSKMVRGVTAALGSEAVAIPTSVAFAEMTKDWGFYYSDGEKLYKAKTTFQHDGNFHFYIGDEYSNLWEYVGLSA